MKVNEFGAELDRNGYAPSIMDSEAGKCYLCENMTHTERHEVFGASNRTKSKALGLWVNLCPHCHREGSYAVHSNKNIARKLKEQAQFDAMAVYGWNRNEFRNRFGKNYV